MEKIKNNFHFRPFDLALVASMAALNFVISFVVAPTLTLFIPHVFLGAFLMVPLDLFLAYLCWAMTGKNVFTLYFFIYGLLTAPTTIWGAMPGLFKPLLGIILGLTLDLIVLKSNPFSKISRYVLGAVFPVIYWFWTVLMWSIAGLPIVKLFQVMINSAPGLNTIVPPGLVGTFITIALLTIPSSIIGVNLATSLSKRLEKIIPPANGTHSAKTGVDKPIVPSE